MGNLLFVVGGLFRKGRASSEVHVLQLSLMEWSQPRVSLEGPVPRGRHTAEAYGTLLLIFGGGTTGGLTWATSTYVLRMLSIPGRDAIKIETPTFTGGVETTEVEWKDIELPVGYHMFQTFQCGKSGKKFWLDDLGEMHDETLPARLEAQLNQE